MGNSALKPRSGRALTNGKLRSKTAIYVVLVVVVGVLGFLVQRPSADASTAGGLDLFRHFVAPQFAIVKLPFARESTFARYPAYRGANEQRYLAYAQKNPQLAGEDVIWRVNVELDKPAYTGALPVADPDSSHALVTKHFVLPQNYVPKQLVAISPGIQATQETRDALIAMQKDAKKAGMRIGVVSAYRSISRQGSIYDRSVSQNRQQAADSYSARPRYSEHNTGRALDLQGPSGGMDGFGSTRESAWVQANSWKYGFIVRYPKGATDVTGYSYEPWHVTYVGKDVSTVMHDKGIPTLEQYVGAQKR